MIRLWKRLQRNISKDQILEKKNLPISYYLDYSIVYHYLEYGIVYFYLDYSVVYYYLDYSVVYYYLDNSMRVLYTGTVRVPPKPVPSVAVDKTGQVRQHGEAHTYIARLVTLARASSSLSSAISSTYFLRRVCTDSGQRQTTTTTHEKKDGTGYTYTCIRHQNKTKTRTEMAVRMYST